MVWVGIHLASEFVLPTPHDELQKEVALKLSRPHHLAEKATTTTVRVDTRWPSETREHWNVSNMFPSCSGSSTMQVLAVNRESLPQVRMQADFTRASPKQKDAAS
jgi:hypothetical protein